MPVITFEYEITVMWQHQGYYRTLPPFYVKGFLQGSYVISFGGFDDFKRLHTWH